METTPSFGDMPIQWLMGDLSAGLQDEHLYPDSKFFTKS